MIQEWLRQTKNYANKIKRPDLICNDGFSMSVQASTFTFCEPLSDTANSYSKVCVLSPSEAEPLLEPYGVENKSGTIVYRYVPVEIIDKIISNHGGINANIECSYLEGLE